MPDPRKSGVMPLCFKASVSRLLCSSAHVSLSRTANFKSISHQTVHTLRITVPRARYIQDAPVEMLTGACVWPSCCQVPDCSRAATPAEEADDGASVIEEPSAQERVMMLR